MPFKWLWRKCLATGLIVSQDNVLVWPSTWTKRTLQSIQNLVSWRTHYHPFLTVFTKAPSQGRSVWIINELAWVRSSHTTLFLLARCWSGQTDKRRVQCLQISEQIEHYRRRCFERLLCPCSLCKSAKIAGFMSAFCVRASTIVIVGMIPVFPLETYLAVPRQDVELHFQ